MTLLKAIVADLTRNRRNLARRVTKHRPDALTDARNEWAADLAVRRESARLVAQARFDAALPRFYTGGPSL
jgi:hypothetical protein